VLVSNGRVQNLAPIFFGEDFPVPDRVAEFERVALCHSQSLLRVARRLTSHSAAEDLVQDCLLLAWRNFHQFQTGTNARAWLFRILFNAFYAEGRKLRRVPDLLPLTAHVRGISSNGAAGGLESAMEVSRALESLQLDHRTVLMLGVVEGFTCGEMAEILGVPVGTVMSRLSRARQAMRSLLSKTRLSETRLTEREPAETKAPAVEWSAKEI
jgi:RNA polymerase sigma-70 factor, ECF subfamily